MKGSVSIQSRPGMIASGKYSTGGAVGFPLVPACTVCAGCIGQPNIGRLTLAGRRGRGRGRAIDVSGPERGRLPSFCMQQWQVVWDRHILMRGRGDEGRTTTTTTGEWQESWEVLPSVPLREDEACPHSLLPRCSAVCWCGALLITALPSVDSTPNPVWSSSS